ncbi:hypothetical protein CVT24_011536 [Panaeolus cyanescens]|uniref:Uncharacterized protein n=1 Tax=Panaeolus cyanescens TaxID=181874 RepID=A0A409VM87_9AGAR|nr:hypothetical protein CVT24_011536 [Panaeolus cyanescens]
MDVDENDELVSVLPIHYSNSLNPDIQIHQFPLINRPLQVPPSARLSGKRITARIRPKARRLEIHVPADTRPEVSNLEKLKEFGRARLEDDREKNQEPKIKMQDDEDPRLSEVRLRSEEIPQKTVSILGIIRDGETTPTIIAIWSKFRPTLTYLDLLSQRSKRSRGGAGDDSDSDDGPPPDPDEAPLEVAVPKKEKKAAEAKEVHATARKVDDAGGPGAMGALSAVRRDMLLMIRTEEEEPWEDLTFCDVATEQSLEVFESLLSHKQEPLESEATITSFLKSIPDFSSTSLPANYNIESPDLGCQDALQFIDVLCRMNDEHTNQDFSIAALQRIEAAVNSLTLFVRNLATIFKDRQDTDAAVALVSIVDPRFIAVLLNLSGAFSRSLSPPMLEEAKGVTCLHILLASFSCTVPMIANGSAYTSKIEASMPGMLRVQREADMIYAAGRLPESWQDVPATLSSSRQSPYTKRIAINLLFAAYVMHPQLCQYLSIPSTNVPPPDLSQLVYQGIKCIFGNLHTMNQTHISPQRQSDAAMLLSLLASTFPLDTQVAEETPWVHSKSLLFTECRSHILHLFQAISGKPEGYQWLIPHEADSPSITIVLKWGSTIPWYWNFFHDEKKAYTEYLSAMTLVWLYHIDSPLFGWTNPNLDYERVTRWMFYNSDAANAMLFHSFHRLESTATNRIMDNSTMQVLRKLMDMYMLALAGSLLNLESCVCYMDIIIESLTYINAEQRAWVLLPLLHKEDHPFMLFLNSAMNDCIMHASVSRISVAMICILEILAVVTVSLPDNNALQNTAIDFIRSLIRYVKRDRQDPGLWNVFKKSLLLLTALGSTGRCDPTAIVEWDLVVRYLDSPCSDIFSAYIVAQYVLLAEQIEDPLVVRELWEHLQDALFVIMNNFSDFEESMRVFLKRWHILTSPWAQCLVRLLDSQSEKIETQDADAWTRKLQIQVSDHLSTVEAMDKEVRWTTNIGFCGHEGLIVVLQNDINVSLDNQVPPSNQR